MVHVPAKFRENTAMCFLRYSAKTKRDGHRQTDGQGRFNITHTGPSAGREIIKYGSCAAGFHNRLELMSTFTYEFCTA